MCSVHDGPIGVGIVGGLGPEFGPEEFVYLGCIAFECECHVGNVGDDGFDTVAFAFDFTVDGGHFVAIFGIIYGR